MNYTIGICGFERDSYIGSPKRYVECVCAAGGIPMILYDNVMLADEYISQIDGLLFVGGGDIAAKYFGQEQHESTSGIDEARDAFEMKLCRLAYEKSIPMFGICRGCQTINVALGGDIIQDIPNHMQTEPLQHHEISVSDGSILHRVFGTKKINVNSYHHQSCEKMADCLKITAVSDDNIIEAFEGRDAYISGVQFHPERSVEYDRRFLLLFTDFINAVKR